MGQDIIILLKKYIQGVEDVCNNLIRTINESENLKLKTKYDFFYYRSTCRKMEFEAEGISYRLHGNGCTAFNEKMFIDWDFGYRSRWCGIEPWKVAMTLKKNNSIHMKYYDGNLIKTACEQLIRQGFMFQQCNQYYFKVAESETFKPNFPTEYDTLVIEYLDLMWSVPRSKVIDKFIRKSIWVYDKIDKVADKYILRFFLNEKEVYMIPYNDVSYPENAVKIMSDVILKELLKCASN